MNIILGGGLAGLAAGHRLTMAGQRAVIIEKGERVGGLARTIRHGAFRFDLGGHRFLTSNPELLQLISDLLGDDLLTVQRQSQIYLRGHYVDYPLQPINAIQGLGLATSASIILDYSREKLRHAWARPDCVSLEDWVVARFGRSMFELYFKDYSEKVWGLPCSRISVEWVDKRIDGLSLGKAIRHAFCAIKAKGYKTLTDSFLYPRLGIGQLSDRLGAVISRRNDLRCATEVQQIYCTEDSITGVQLANGRDTTLLRGNQYLSSIPLTVLLKKMSPAPPPLVLEAANRIGFRSLTVVTLMLKKKRATNLTWLYFPDKQIPFGRIHEPTNWSPDLAPANHTHLVTEFFCDQGDSIWSRTDGELVVDTVRHLVSLGILTQAEVVDSRVLRIPHAYPVFSVDYRKQIAIITDWLSRFSNLKLIGRSGSYSYLNMDQAMESGMAAADTLMARPSATCTYPEQLAALPNRV